MGYLRVDTLPGATGPRRQWELRLATELGVAFAEAKQLLETLPVRLPRSLEAELAQSLLLELQRGGGTGAVLDEAERGHASCPGHAQLEATEHCSECGRYWCVLCVVPNARAKRCPECGKKHSRRRGFFHLRVGILLSILLTVVLFAYGDYRRRSVRTDWERPLNVAIVLLPDESVEAQLLEQFARGLHALGERLDAEFRRVRGGSGDAVAFTVAGVVRGGKLPPKPKAGGFGELLQTNYDLWQFSRSVDAQLQTNPADFDSRIYVAVKTPRDGRISFVEGFSQQGGHLGVVEVEVTDSTVDFALFVVAHELFHTLGGTDKYGPDGRVLVPMGLAEPELQPLYPQRHVEIMARNRPVTPDTEHPPDSLQELMVGEQTAREIGWIRE